ncbi:hypothetical protein D3C81_1864080 [compost metagenome]
MNKVIQFLPAGEERCKPVLLKERQRLTQLFNQTNGERVAVHRDARFLQRYPALVNDICLNLSHDHIETCTDNDLRGIAGFACQFH